MREVKGRRFLVGRLWRMRNIRFIFFSFSSFFFWLVADLEKGEMNDCLE